MSTCCQNFPGCSHHLASMTPEQLERWKKGLEAIVKNIERKPDSDRKHKRKHASNYTPPKKRRK